MENKLIVGNIKMNMEYGEIANYLEQFKNIKNKNVIICPSFIYIPYFLDQGFEVGSQNVCMSVDGGFTGEISAKQLSSIGIKYTIVGHSERRIKLKETSLEINKKIKNLLMENINVILCIGETKEERDLLKTNISIKRQIIDSLSEITNLENVVIAYEPIWSVGTNVLPSKSELIDSVKYIKFVVKKFFNSDIRVIYGGSINENNITEIKNINELDGFLIGSASINPNQFIEIINKII